MQYQKLTLHDELVDSSESLVFYSIIWFKPEPKKSVLRCDDWREGFATVTSHYVRVSVGSVPNLEKVILAVVWVFDIEIVSEIHADDVPKLGWNLNEKFERMYDIKQIKLLTLCVIANESITVTAINV